MSAAAILLWLVCGWGKGKNHKK